MVSSVHIINHTSTTQQPLADVSMIAPPQEMSLGGETAHRRASDVACASEARLCVARTQPRANTFGMTSARALGPRTCELAILRRLRRGCGLAAPEPVAIFLLLPHHQN